MWGKAEVPLVCAAATLLSLLWVGVLQRRLRMEAGKRRHAEALFAELHAYALLDPRVDAGEGQRTLAKRVCRTIAAKSGFRSSAMLVRDADGRMVVAGSLGTDDLAGQALERWAAGLPDATVTGGRMSSGMEAALGRRVGRSSFAVRLERRQRGTRTGEPDATQMRCRGMIAVPIWTAAGRLEGVLAVCADPGAAAAATLREEMLQPLEALATKLGRTLENQMLTEQLLRAEKLAGLGQLAGGVAHALNNPLTAVLGFSELIADTASEPRVRTQARFIMSEAKRMQETVQSLLNFWRPPAQTGEPVEVLKLLEELGDACASKLESRGVRLEIQAGESMPPVRGSQERLREALEHLLNNAAQAISAVQETSRHMGEAEQGSGEHVIRLTANYSAGMLHMIVSDTGPGFKEPRRVFDPFYTTQPGVAAGMGLSLCYGIVREHGGEIRAVNLYPRGAAVVLELPVREAVVTSMERVVVGEVA